MQSRSSLQGSKILSKKSSKCRNVATLSLNHFRTTDAMNKISEHAKATAEILQDLKINEELYDVSMIHVNAPLPNAKSNKKRKNPIEREASFVSVKDLHSATESLGPEKMEEGLVEPLSRQGTELLTPKSGRKSDLSSF